MTKNFVKNPNLRQGQFLWRSPEDKNRYIESVKSKIETHYYFSEKVIGKIVDQIADVFNEIIV